MLPYNTFSLISLMWTATVAQQVALPSPGLSQLLSLFFGFLPPLTGVCVCVFENHLAERWIKPLEPIDWPPVKFCLIEQSANHSNGKTRINNEWMLFHVSSWTDFISGGQSSHIKSFDMILKIEYYKFKGTL